MFDLIIEYKEVKIDQFQMTIIFLGRYDHMLI